MGNLMPIRQGADSGATGERSLANFGSQFKFGEESPLPGREKDYEDAMAQGIYGLSGRNGPSPARRLHWMRRRSRSPGLVKKFDDVPTADSEAVGSQPVGNVPTGGSDELSRRRNSPNSALTLNSVS